MRPSARSRNGMESTILPTLSCRLKHTVNELAGDASVVRRLEQSSEVGDIQVGADGRVARQHLAQVLPVGDGFAGCGLDQFVRGRFAQMFPEGDGDSLGVDEATGYLEILAHPRCVDLQTGDGFGKMMQRSRAQPDD